MNEKRSDRCKKFKKTSIHAEEEEERHQETTIIINEYDNDNQPIGNPLTAQYQHKEKKMKVYK